MEDPGVLLFLKRKATGVGSLWVIATPQDSMS